MDFYNLREDFFNRFGLDFSMTQNEGGEFIRIGVKNILTDIDLKLTKNEIIKFCSQFGFETKFSTQHFLGAKQIFRGFNIYNCINAEGNFTLYLFKIQSLFNLNFQKNFFESEQSNIKNELYDNIRNLFINSNLPLNFICANNIYIIKPSGSKFLDDELIVKPLKFLETKSNQHFVDALNLFTQKNYIKSLESCRRTLEEYLRFFFKNKQGLERNINNLKDYFKIEKKEVKQIKQILFDFFNYLDKFYNENSKHDDGDVDQAICELIILQTGLLLKYLDNLKS